MPWFETYESPVGTLYLTAREGILTGLSFYPEQTQSPADPAVHCWLEDYFCGNFREIDFPIETTGTPFQNLIWKLLQEIPFGKTETYGGLSRKAAQIMGREYMSPQAVGQAVGRNPIAIIIPCHRVVGAGGKMTGYAYGISKKQWLLQHELKREDAP